MYEVHHVNKDVDPFVRCALPEQLTYYCDEKWSKHMVDAEFEELLLAQHRQFRDIHSIISHRDDHGVLTFEVTFRPFPGRATERPERVDSAEVDHASFAAYFRRCGEDGTLDVSLTREAQRRGVIR